MTGSSHLWADEVEQEDAAKGIPPPEKFTPAPEWRGSGNAPSQPRAFSYQPPDAASPPSGHNADGRHETPPGWDDGARGGRGGARSRLDMGHGFVRHIAHNQHVRQDYETQWQTSRDPGDEGGRQWIKGGRPPNDRRGTGPPLRGPHFGGPPQQQQHQPHPAQHEPPFGKRYMGARSHLPPEGAPPPGSLRSDTGRWRSDDISTGVDTGSNAEDKSWWRRPAVGGDTKVSTSEPIRILAQPHQLGTETSIGSGEAGLGRTPPSPSFRPPRALLPPGQAPKASGASSPAAAVVKAEGADRNDDRKRGQQLLAHLRGRPGFQGGPGDSVQGRLSDAIKSCDGQLQPQAMATGGGANNAAESGSPPGRLHSSPLIHKIADRNTGSGPNFREGRSNVAAKQLPPRHASEQSGQHSGRLETRTMAGVQHTEVYPTYDLQSQQEWDQQPGGQQQRPPHKVYHVSQRKELWEQPARAQQQQQQEDIRWQQGQRQQQEHQQGQHEEQQQQQQQQESTGQQQETQWPHRGLSGQQGAGHSQLISDQGQMPNAHPAQRDKQLPVDQPPRLMGQMYQEGQWQPPLGNGAAALQFGQMSLHDALPAHQNPQQQQQLRHQAGHYHGSEVPYRLSPGYKQSTSVPVGLLPSQGHFAHLQPGNPPPYGQRTHHRPPPLPPQLPYSQPYPSDKTQYEQAHQQPQQQMQLQHLPPPLSLPLPPPLSSPPLQPRHDFGHQPQAYPYPGPPHPHQQEQEQAREQQQSPLPHSLRSEAEKLAKAEQYKQNYERFIDGQANYRSGPPQGMEPSPGGSRLPPQQPPRHPPPEPRRRQAPKPGYTAYAPPASFPPDPPPSILQQQPPQAQLDQAPGPSKPKPGNGYEMEGSRGPGRRSFPLLAGQEGAALLPPLANIRGNDNSGSVNVAAAPEQPTGDRGASRGRFAREHNRNRGQDRHDIGNSHEQQARSRQHSRDRARGSRNVGSVPVGQQQARGRQHSRDRTRGGHDAGSSVAGQHQARARQHSRDRARGGPDTGSSLAGQQQARGRQQQHKQNDRRGSSRDSSHRATSAQRPVASMVPRSVPAAEGADRQQSPAGGAQSLNNRRNQQPGDRSGSSSRRPRQGSSSRAGSPLPHLRSSQAAAVKAAAAAAAAAASTFIDPSPLRGAIDSVPANETALRRDHFPAVHTSAARHLDSAAPPGTLQQPPPGRISGGSGSGNKRVVTVPRSPATLKRESASSTRSSSAVTANSSLDSSRGSSSGPPGMLVNSARSHDDSTPQSPASVYSAREGQALDDKATPGPLPPAAATAAARLPEGGVVTAVASNNQGGPGNISVGDGNTSGSAAATEGHGKRKSKKGSRRIQQRSEKGGNKAADSATSAATSASEDHSSDGMLARLSAFVVPSKLFSKSMSGVSSSSKAAAITKAKNGKPK